MFNSPPSEWSDRNNEEARDIQLLKELEALNKALYPPESTISRKKTPEHVLEKELQRNMPSPKKYSLFSRKYFSSLHEPRGRETKDAYVGQEEIKSFPPPLDPHHHSRHSTYMPKKKIGVIKSHLSFSDSTAMSPSWAEREAEVRSRRDRRLSLEDVEIENVNKSSSPEQFQDFSQKLDSSLFSNKSKSVWSWKPMRAISHLGRQKLQCIFSIHVSEIQSLPAAMNGLRLCVHMRKLETREGAVQTMPTRVFQGNAEFEERLFMKCTLYSNKGHSNTTKFMEKSLIISVISPDIDGINFGKHQLDLSKLLAHLMDEKGRGWDTRLDLTGKAIGGKLAIGVGCEVLSKDGANSGNTSSRFMFSTSHGTSSQLSYSLPNSAHATPVPLSSGDSQSVLEQSDEDKQILVVDPNSPTRGDTPSIDKSDIQTHETDQRFSLDERIGRDRVCETELEELAEEEIEFVVIDRGIESTGSIELPPINEPTVIDRGLRIGEKGKRVVDDVDWQIIEEIEECCAKKEDEVNANAAEGLSACKLHEGLETEAHGDDTEKIITVDEGEMRDLALHRIVMESLVSPVQGNRIEEQESHVLKPEEEENIGVEHVTGDLKWVTGNSILLKETSAASDSDMEADLGSILKDIELERADKGEDLDNEVDLVAGEFLKLLEGEEDLLKHASELESPRALLLKQFEEELMMQGCFGMHFKASSRMAELSLDAEFEDNEDVIDEGTKKRR